MEQLLQYFRILRTQIAQVVRRGTVVSVTEIDGVQRVKLDFGGGDIVDGHRVQQYGFTSHPKKGGQAVVVNIGGTRGVPICIVSDDGAYRIELEEGESAMYNDKGKFFKMGTDGKIYTNADIETTGSIRADGGIYDGADRLKDHVHTPGTFVSPSGPVTGLSGPSQ